MSRLELVMRYAGAFALLCAAVGIVLLCGGGH